MKPAGFLLAGLLVIAGAALYWFQKRGEPAPSHSIPAVPEQGIAHRERLPLQMPARDGDAETLRRLDLALARLDALEEGMRDLSRALTRRVETPRPVDAPSPPEDGPIRLDEQDLEKVRSLIHAELAAEAWKVRQRELVRMARFLANEIPLEAMTVDALVDVLCRTGWAFFELERELAEEDYDRRLAKRLAPRFRHARIQLHQELAALYRDREGELVARLFLHVASEGEVAALSMERDEVLELREEWLR